MVSSTLFSSGDIRGSYEWETPRSLFNELNAPLGFDMDLAASFLNPKCERYFGPTEFVLPEYFRLRALETDEKAEVRAEYRDSSQEFLTKMGCNSLHIPWHEHSDRGWLNPPYGRIIGDFTQKAVEEVKAGMKSVTILVPVRTDTEWFHRDIAPHRERAGYTGPHRKVCAIVTFLRGRVKYEVLGESMGTAPFPSMVCHLFAVGGSNATL